LNSLSSLASISTYTKKIPLPLCATCQSPLSFRLVSCACTIASEAHARRETSVAAILAHRSRRHVPLIITFHRKTGRKVKDRARGQGCDASELKILTQIFEPRKTIGCKRHKAGSKYRAIVPYQAWEAAEILVGHIHQKHIRPRHKAGRYTNSDHRNGHQCVAPQ